MISPINLISNRYPSFKAKKQTKTPEVQVREPQKIDPVKQKAIALLLASTLTLGLSGCTSKETRKPLPNQTIVETYQSGLTISDDLREENQALAFGVDLYNEALKNPNLNVKKYIQNYLKENGYKNVSIEKLDSSEVPNLKGRYMPSYDENLNYIGGTLYLTDLPKTKDDKETLTYCAVVAHEMQHLFYYSENDWPSQTKKSPIIHGDDEIIQTCAFATSIRDLTREILQYKPFEYLMMASYGSIPDELDVKISKEDADSACEDLDRYNFFFSKPYSKPLENIVQGAFQQDGGFSFCAQDTFKTLLAEFYAMGSLPLLRNQDGVDLVKSNFTYILEDEADAYEINSKMMKLYQGLDPDETTLNDLIPTTYRMLADEIRKTDYQP